MKSTFNHKGIYKCICGKEFDNSQSYNAHKGNCIVILGEEEYQRRLEKRNSQLIKGNKNKLSQLKIKKAEDLDRWISERHKCERCGKIMTEKFGAGRFCSRSCANSRYHSDMTKQKIKESVHNTLLTKKNEEVVINAKHFITGYYNDIYCGSSYELIFVLYCEKHNIKVERCKYTFEYIYNGSKRVYVPDFYLPESNTIIELKGKNNFYNKKIVDLKADAAQNSNMAYKIIYDEEFNFKYLNWFLNYYNIARSNYKKYRYVCEKLLTKNNPKISSYIDKKHYPRTLGYKYMKKDNKLTCIPKDKISEYLSNGWVLIKK